MDSARKLAMDCSGRDKSDRILALQSNHWSCNAMSKDKPAPPPQPVHVEKGYKPIMEGYKPAPQTVVQPAKGPPAPPTNTPNQGSGGKKPK